MSDETATPMSDEQLADIGRRLAEDTQFPTYPECSSTGVEDVAALYAEVVRLRADAKNRNALIESYQRVLALPR